MSRFLKKEEVKRERSRSRTGSSLAMVNEDEEMGGNIQRASFGKGSRVSFAGSPVSFKSDTSEPTTPLSFGDSDPQSPGSGTSTGGDEESGSESSTSPTNKGSLDNKSKSDAANGGPAELTPMMKSLNELARLKARENIQRKIRDPVDLEDLTILRNQLQKQAIVAASQLNGAVQSKLEALKRAADLMDATSAQLGKYHTTLDYITPHPIVLNRILT